MKRNNNIQKDCYDSHPVLEKIHDLYHTLLDHDGFGELRMDVRILRRGQKEVIIHFGKQYRFIVDTTHSQDDTAGKETYDPEGQDGITGKEVPRTRNDLMRQPDNPAVRCERGVRAESDH